MQLVSFALDFSIYLRLLYLFTAHTLQGNATCSDNRQAKQGAST